MGPIRVLHCSKLESSLAYWAIHAILQQFTSITNIHSLETFATPIRHQARTLL
jgi:hypothetical protein